MIKYWKVKASSYSFKATTTTKMLRIVNQDEIVDFVKNNPGKTENDIMYQIYDYDRSVDGGSNKKYAECLRRALRSDKLSRAQHRFPDGRSRYVYFAK